MHAHGIYSLNGFKQKLARRLRLLMIGRRRARFTRRRARNRGNESVKDRTRYIGSFRSNSFMNDLRATRNVQSFGGVYSFRSVRTYRSRVERLVRVVHIIVEVVVVVQVVAGATGVVVVRVVAVVVLAVLVQHHGDEHFRLSRRQVAR